MLSLEVLRLAAQSVPAVLVDSAQLLELLDAAERVPKRRKPRNTEQQEKDAIEDEKCARWLYGVLLNTLPTAKEPNFKAWANDIRRMREIDEKTRRQICELFQWAQAHNFWRSNVRCPSKLREHWDCLWIQRDTAAQPKPAATSAWWTSEASKLAKALEVGVGPALAGESAATWEGRIRAAIDNGGAPPAPAAHIRPVGPAANAPEQKGTKPEGLDLRALLRRAPPAPPAQAA